MQQQQQLIAAQQQQQQFSQLYPETTQTAYATLYPTVNNSLASLNSLPAVHQYYQQQQQHKQHVSQVHLNSSSNYSNKYPSVNQSSGINVARNHNSNSIVNTTLASLLVNSSGSSTSATKTVTSSVASTSASEPSSDTTVGSGNLGASKVGVRNKVTGDSEDTKRSLDEDDNNSECSGDKSPKGIEHDEQDFSDNEENNNTMMQAPMVGAGGVPVGGLLEMPPPPCTPVYVDGAGGVTLGPGGTLIGGGGSVVVGSGSPPSPGPASGSSDSGAGDALHAERMEYIRQLVQERDQLATTDGCDVAKRLIEQGK